MGSSFKAFVLLLVISSLPHPTQADPSPFQILPWNGYKAALSLTFDDGDPIHLDLVIPELDKRGLKGTFFLIAAKLDRLTEWQKASQEGHEIGNHSLDHKHLTEYGPNGAVKQVVEAKKILEKDFGIPILTYAYPYFETNGELEKTVDENDFIARGGFGVFEMNPDQDINWSNIPSRGTATGIDYTVYQQWIDQDIADGCWTVFLTHGVEGTPWGFQPVPKAVFLKLLDYLAERKKDLWIAPFGTVGAYWKAQKVIEAAEPHQDGTTLIWKWKKPQVFPLGVVLKIHIAGEGIQVTQGGKVVEPLAGSIYPVSFDAQELKITHCPWKASDINGDLPPATKDIDKDNP